MPDPIAKRSARAPSTEATTSLAEWIWVTIFLVTLSLVIGWQDGLNHIELTFYDSLLSLQQRPADSNIVLVGIDEASVTEFGPPPFSVDVEARLIEALNAAKPRAIGFLVPLGTRLDAALAAPGAASREKLAQLLAANGHVALNSGPFGNGVESSKGYAGAPLLEGAAAVGSNAPVLDDDGVLRRAALSFALGTQSSGEDHFVTALLAASGMRVALPGLRASEIDGGPTGVGDHWVLIPYAGPPGHYPVIPLRDVVDGRVPQSALAGKFVIVGATARQLVHYEKVPAGLADGFASRLMTPLEIDANLLAGVITGSAITALSPLRNALACGLPVMLAMLVLIAGSRRALGLILALAFLTFAAALLGIAFFRVWYAPGGALVGLALALPLWRWRLLEGDAMRSDMILRRLEQGANHYAEVGLPAINANAGRVERRLQTLNRTIARIDTLRDFIDHILEAMPHVTLVTDAEGHVMAANRQAKNYFGSLGNTHIDGAQLPYLLGLLELEGTADGRSWWDVMDRSLSGSRVRARDARGRDLVIRVVPWHNAHGDVNGWVGTIDDVSAIRASERRRDEALNFMSKSLGATQLGILEALSTLDVSQLGPAEAALTQSIEAASSEALALTDKFVELSNAESRDYDFVACDLSDAVELAIDAAYAAAERHHAHIAYARPPSAVIANIDTSMLSRAISILIANAVRFSAKGEVVEVALTCDDEHVILTVTDHGRGISPIDQVRMLRALQDIHLPGASSGSHGHQIGLGLSLVQTVVEKHFGKLEFTSNPGSGSEFRIVLPAWSPPLQSALESDSNDEAAL